MLNQWSTNPPYQHVTYTEIYVKNWKQDIVVKMQLAYDVEVFTERQKLA